MAAPSVLSPGQEIKPRLDDKTAVYLLRALYGLSAKKIRELDAYDDKNYHVICESLHKNPYLSEIPEDGFVLKILNSLDSRNVEFVEAQNEMMLYLNKREIPCTVPVKNLQGSFYSVEKLQDESEEGHVVRLLVYQTGLTLHTVPVTIDLLRDVGHFTARLDSVLANFTHRAYDDRQTLWMLAAVPRLRDFVFALKNDEDRSTVFEVVGVFEKEVLPVAAQLERGIIHGDLNEQNLLVDRQGTKIVAVIDFGDTHKTCLVFELAIAICYMIIQTRDLKMARYVIEGYQMVKKISNVEKGLLKTCVCARLCQSLTLGAYSHSKDPKNEYLLTTQKPGWEALKNLWPMDGDEVLNLWGLENSQ